jgi:hypothetical protein
MRTVILNAEEMELLFRQDPATKQDGGWQGLLVALQEATDRTTGECSISPILLTRIGRYGFDHGEGGYENRLRAIFGRTLGENLGQQLVE